MSTEQVTLGDCDRGESDPSTTYRFIISVLSSEHPAAEMTVFEVVRDVGMEFGGFSLEKAQDLADLVINDSPVLVGSARLEIDKYCLVAGSISEVIAQIKSTTDENVTIDEIIVPKICSLGYSLSEVAESLYQLSQFESSIKTNVFGDDNDIILNPKSEITQVAKICELADYNGISLHRKAEKRDIRRWSDIDKTGGRPGLGFTWVDGELVPADDYTHVCSILEMVQEGEMSKRKAAAHLDTSSRTISRCLEERSDRYGL